MFSFSFYFPSLFFAMKRFNELNNGNGTTEKAMQPNNPILNGCICVICRLFYSQCVLLSRSLNQKYVFKVMDASQTILPLVVLHMRFLLEQKRNGNRIFCSPVFPYSKAAAQTTIKIEPEFHYQLSSIIAFISFLLDFYLPLNVTLNLCFKIDILLTLVDDAIFI